MKQDPGARIQTAEEFAKRIEEVSARENVRTDPQELRAFADKAVAARPVVTMQVKPGDLPLSSGSGKRSLPEAARAPVSPAAKTVIEKTQRWEGERRAEAPAAPRPRPTGLILAAAAILAALGGYWIWQRSRPAPESAGLSTPVTESAAPAATQAPLAPTAAVPEPTAPPPPVAAAEAAPPTAAPRPPRAKPTRSVESVAALNPRSAEAPGAIPAVPAQRVRYCATVEPTSYAQAAVKEKPAGFDTGGGEVFRGPRPDAARIAIQVDVSPRNPVSGEPFRVVARLINGGDTSITLSRIEESAVRAPGGFQAVSSVSAPATVEVGAAFTIYSTQAVLTEGNAYSKDVKVTDAVGDTWKTAIRVSVCPE